MPTAEELIAAVDAGDAATVASIRCGGFS